MNNEKGITLIELIVSMAIAFVLLGVTFSILNIGVRSHGSAINNYDAQVDVRYAIETINNTIRYASVGFAVTADDFAPVENAGDIDGLVKPWNYVGLSPDNNSVVHYKFVDDGGDGYYDVETLVEAFDGLSYSIQFNKANPSNENKILRYILDGYRNGNELFSQTTEVNALNAIQIIDWGDASNPSIALAYRTEETPEITNRPIAAMSMVLDTSGSMTYRVDGSGIANDDTPPSDSRIEILKNSLKQMVTDLRSNSNVYASLIPFSTTANIPHVNFDTSITNPSEFRLITSDGNDDWDDLINSLRARDGTNTGDGIRRGYYQSLDFNDNTPSEIDEDQEILNFMVILVDGKTTMGSADVYRSQERRTFLWFEWWEDTNDFYYDFILDSVNIDSSRINANFVDDYNDYTGDSSDYRVVNYRERRPIGDGLQLDPQGTEYVNILGERLIQGINPPTTYGARDLAFDNNVFIIGFSDVEDDLSSVKDIANAVGIPVESDDSDINSDFIDNNKIYIARSASDLEGVFTEIGGYISEKLWQVEGPTTD